MEPRQDDQPEPNSIATELMPWLSGTLIFWGTVLAMLGGFIDIPIVRTVGLVVNGLAFLGCLYRSAPRENANGAFGGLLMLGIGVLPVSVVLFAGVGALIGAVMLATGATTEWMAILEMAGTSALLATGMVAVLALGQALYWARCRLASPRAGSATGSSPTTPD